MVGYCRVTYGIKEILRFIHLKWNFCEIVEEIRSNKSYRIQLLNSRGANSSGDFAKTTVPDMYCFVLGENRANSLDSRHFGPVPLADVLGKIDFIYFPAGSWSRFGRFPQ